MDDTKLLNSILRALGPMGSISHSIDLQLPDELPVKLFQARLVPNNHLHLDGSRVGSGASKTALGATLLAAIGEALERYALGIPIHSLKLQNFKSVDEAQRVYGASAVSLDELRRIQGLHDFQFSLPSCRLSPIQAASQFDWIQAERFNDGSEVFVPQELARLRNRSNLNFEVTTNGCALSESRESATLSAFYELIERDNFMLFWWNKKTPTFVDFKEDLSKLNPTLLAAFGPWLKYIHVVYCPGPLNVPTFVSFFRSENAKNHPAFFVSAASNLDPRKALEGTLQELGAILNSKLIKHYTSSMPVDRFNYDFDLEFTDFKDHHEFYMHDRNAEFVPFGTPAEPTILFSQIQNQNAGSTKENLALLRKRLELAGHSPIVIDQTTRDIRELGLHVVRVIDAEIVDLNAAHAHRRWGKRRLYSGHIQTPAELYHWPHPFP